METKNIIFYHILKSLWAKSLQNFKSFYFSPPLWRGDNILFRILSEHFFNCI